MLHGLYDGDIHTFRTIRTIRGKGVIALKMAPLLLARISHMHICAYFLLLSYLLRNTYYVPYHPVPWGRAVHAHLWPVGWGAKKAQGCYKYDYQYISYLVK